MRVEVRVEGVGRRKGSERGSGTYRFTERGVFLREKEMWEERTDVLEKVKKELRRMVRDERLDELGSGDERTHEPGLGKMGRATSGVGKTEGGDRCPGAGRDGGETSEGSGGEDEVGGGGVSGGLRARRKKRKGQRQDNETQRPTRTRKGTDTAGNMSQ